MYDDAKSEVENDDRLPPDPGAVDPLDDDAAYENLLARAEREIEQTAPPEKQTDEPKSPQWTPPPPVSPERPDVRAETPTPAEAPQIAAAHSPASDPLAVFGQRTPPAESVQPQADIPPGPAPLPFPEAAQASLHPVAPQATPHAAEAPLGIPAVDRWFEEFGEIQSRPVEQREPIAPTSEARHEYDIDALRRIGGGTPPLPSERVPIEPMPPTAPQQARVQATPPREPQQTGVWRSIDPVPDDGIGRVVNHYHVAWDSEQIGEELGEFVMEELAHELIPTMDALGRKLNGPMLHTVERLRDNQRRAASHQESFYPRV